MVLVQPAQADRKVQRVLQAELDLQDKKVLQVQQVQAEVLDRKVQQVLLDQQVVLVLLDHKELKVRRVKKAK